MSGGWGRPEQISGSGGHLRKGLLGHLVTARQGAAKLNNAHSIRALVAWTQLFGMVTFELFGQLVGSADPSDEFFAFAVDEMADFIGFPP